MVGEANSVAEQLGIAERLPQATNRLQIASFSTVASRIDTNGAYQLATQYKLPPELHLPAPGLGETGLPPTVKTYYPTRRCRCSVNC